MIVTVSDESNYLLNVTKYMVISLAKHMPSEKLFVVIVNGRGKYDEIVKKWHPNLVILHYKLELENKKGLYFCFMALPLYDLLSKYDEPLIYIDGDVIIKDTLLPLFKELDKYDLLVRYRPFLDFNGPMATKYGARTNSGVLALSNKPEILEFVLEFKNRIINFIKDGKEPISWNEQKTSLTGVDQELLWLLIMEFKDKVNFFPLNDRYNDSYFNSDSAIWHAKGIARKSPEYLMECHKYQQNNINVIREYARLNSQKFKKFIKGFLIEPNETFLIKELGDILSTTLVKKVVIVNSNFYLDNEQILKNKDIVCYDTDPVVYYNNKYILENKRIEHHYIIYDTQTIEINEQVDLLICDTKNKKVSNNINFKAKINKDV